MEEDRVLGFALEPKSTKSSNKQKTTLTNENTALNSREKNIDNHLWCMCGRCSVMCGDFFLEEDECVCCYNLKHIRDNFDLISKNTIDHSTHARIFYFLSF